MDRLFIESESLGFWGTCFARGSHFLKPKAKRRSCSKLKMRDDRTIRRRKRHKYSGIFEYNNGDDDEEDVEVTWKQQEQEQKKTLSSFVDLLLILVIAYLWMRTTLDLIIQHKKKIGMHQRPSLTTKKPRIFFWENQQPILLNTDKTTREILSSSTVANDRMTMMLENSVAQPFETEKCKAQYGWQLKSFPTCNIVHEVDMLHDQINKDLRFIADGHYRDVWSWDHLSLANGDNETKDRERFALKTLRYVHNFDERSFDRHRRDALVMERLTSSNYVIDIFSYCANSGLFDYGGSGTIHSAISHSLKESTIISPIHKLQISAQVAMALKHVHSTDSDYFSAIVHGDIKADQFVLIDGIYKLNDFNKGRFMRWNIEEEKPCGFTGIVNIPWTIPSSSMLNHS